LVTGDEFGVLDGFEVSGLWIVVINDLSEIRRKGMGFTSCQVIFIRGGYSFGVLITDEVAGGIKWEFGPIAIIVVDKLGGDGISCYAVVLVFMDVNGSVLRGFGMDYGCGMISETVNDLVGIIKGCGMSGLVGIRCFFRSKISCRVNDRIFSCSSKLMEYK